MGLALYNIYASYAREKGVAFPSQEKIAKTLKISIPTLIKYNKILEENGLIKVEKRKGRKKNVVLYLDPEVVREAKELGLNLSKICENALKDPIKKLKDKDCNNMAGPGGFEPPTCGLGGRRAILATLRAHLCIVSYGNTVT